MTSRQTHTNQVQKGKEDCWVIRRLTCAHARPLSTCQFVCSQLLVPQSRVGEKASSPPPCADRGPFISAEHQEAQEAGRRNQRRLHDSQYDQSWRPLLASSVLGDRRIGFHQKSHHPTMPRRDAKSKEKVPGMGGGGVGCNQGPGAFSSPSTQPGGLRARHQAWQKFRRSGSEDSFPAFWGGGGGGAAGQRTFIPFLPGCPCPLALVPCPMSPAPCR